MRATLLPLLMALVLCTPCVAEKVNNPLGGQQAETIYQLRSAALDPNNGGVRGWRWSFTCSDPVPRVLKMKVTYITIVAGQPNQEVSKEWTSTNQGTGEPEVVQPGVAWGPPAGANVFGLVTEGKYTVEMWADGREDKLTFVCQFNGMHQPNAKTHQMMDPLIFGNTYTMRTIADRGGNFNSIPCFGDQAPNFPPTNFVGTSAADSWVMLTYTATVNCPQPGVFIMIIVPDTAPALIANASKAMCGEQGDPGGL